MKEQIQEFQNKVENLQEVNIGDFRRRLDLYINRLDEDLGSKEEIKNFIRSLKNEALYKHQEIEDIREEVLQKISFFLDQIKNQPICKLNTYSIK